MTVYTLPDGPVGPSGFMGRSPVKSGRYAEPKPPRCAVYYHYDEAGVLLYIGVADWPPARNLNHSIFAQWVPFAARMEAVWCNSRADALRFEGQEVRTRIPVFNSQYIPAGRAERVAAYLAARGPVAASASAVPAVVARPQRAPSSERAQTTPHQTVDGAAKKIRKAAGITLAQMAAVLGVDESTLSRWESGSRTPKSHHAREWGRLLNELERASTSASTAA